MSAAADALTPEAEIAAWLIEEGTVGEDLALVLGRFADRLVAIGVPLMRVYLAMPVINADLRALSYQWRRGEAARREEIPHEREGEEFERSPFRLMLEAGESIRRWPLATLGPTGFDVLDRLRDDGATDHLTCLVTFDPTNVRALRGAAMSFTTDSPAGFTDSQVFTLSRFTRLLGLVACRFGLSSLVSEVLHAYVGNDAGERVLRGEIRRGDGHRRSAALLVADLRGFTTVADRAGKSLVPRLGRHLAAMAEPVEEAGGEVLKFMGDGLLAAFPADEERSRETACPAALRAGLEALRRNALVNRAHIGEPELALDVALHLGDVFYGNIGAASRLDFTVIGPAVNEACRIETLCKELGRPLLMSAPFAEACGRPTESLGRHVLRGVAEPRAIFGLPGL